MNNLHSIINKRGYYTAEHPDTAKGTDDEQDDNGCSYSGNVVCNCFFVVLPWNAVEDHSYQDTRSGGDKQRKLAASV